MRRGRGAGVPDHNFTLGFPRVMAVRQQNWRGLHRNLPIATVAQPAAVAVATTIAAIAAAKSAVAAASPAVHRGDAQAAPCQRQELADRLQRHHARHHGQGARLERGAPVVRRLPGRHVHRNGHDQAERSRPRPRRPEWLKAHCRRLPRQLQWGHHRLQWGQPRQCRPEWRGAHCR